MPLFTFDHSYRRLGDAFFRDCSPTPVSHPALICLNDALATQLGFDGSGLTEAILAEYFSGNRILPGAMPMATVYAGHQFGMFNPQLGDGRALLLGEVVTGAGERFDVQLKGAGPTPYSRGGDGRSPLGPVLREYLISEAMQVLGVPTTRALAAVTSGDRVYREQPLPGAILVRVASSHIRVGTFQFFAARRDLDSLRVLTDHVIQRHYPDAANAPKPWLAMLAQVVQRQAALIARWMSLGFIHGVMNTDNMLVCGETVDYGPCAFMDTFDPATVFSSIDRGGRYAWQQQPGIAQWNLARLAECLLLLEEDIDAAIPAASEVISGFVSHYRQAWRQIMAAKLGIRDVQERDDELVQTLLDLMTEEKLDFTLLFDRLVEQQHRPAVQPLQGLATPSRRWQDWLARWQARLDEEGTTSQQRVEIMRHHSPMIIPRNHRVEQAITAATEQGDFALFHRLRQALAQPFNADDDTRRWLAPPAPGEQVYRTFCGT